MEAPSVSRVPGRACGNQDYGRSVPMVGATQVWCTNKDDLSLLFAFVFSSCVLSPGYSSVSTCALRQCDVTRRGRDGDRAAITWPGEITVPRGVS